MRPTPTARASSEMLKPLCLQHDRLLEQAVKVVSALPDEAQDDLARILLQLAGVDQPPYKLTAEEAADLDTSLAEAAQGEFATEEEVRAVWAKHGL